MIFHVTQTADYGTGRMISHEDYMLHLEHVNTDIQLLVLACFRYFGSLGNAMFFIASAWFLTDSKQNNKKKWLLMLLDVWFISVIIAAVAYLFIGGSDDMMPHDLIKYLMPNTFTLNWYATCYLLFYLAYPFLNKLINSIPQKTHFRIVFVLVFLYIICDFIYSQAFFPSVLILWMTIYFLMAYMKSYRMTLMDNQKFNLAVFILAILANIVLILATNFLGLHTGIMADGLIYWAANCNPFLLLIAFSGLNLARSIHWVNKGVNAVASLSLFIYLIHENDIVRRYLRPLIMDKLYHAYGYSHVLAIVLIFALVLFLVSTILSFIYKATVHKILQKNIGRIYEFFARGYRRIEKKIL